MFTRFSTAGGEERRRSILIVASWIAVVAVLLVVALPGADASSGRQSHSGSVVVANRLSGDITVFDEATRLPTTVALPGPAEPMYVTHDRGNGLVLVGNRAASTIVAFDDDTFAVVDEVAVGDGVFHQWLDARRSHLWVVGDSSGTVSVVDTATLELVTTFAIPADLSDDGARPHDVFVSGRHAFVSFVGLAGGDGVVVRYDARTFAETGRIMTGGDPHLFVRGSRLYVASQDASTVTAYKANTLTEVGSANVATAHGIWVTQQGKVLVTNIAGGGVEGLHALNRRLDRVHDVVDLPTAIPHNVAVDSSGAVWITHSGATADQVSIVETGRSGFGVVAQASAGGNPFGLAYVSP